MKALRAIGGAERLGSSFTAARRLAVYLALTLPLIPVQFALLALKSPLSRRLPHVYDRLCCRIFGFNIAYQDFVLRSLRSGQVLA